MLIARLPQHLLPQTKEVQLKIVPSLLVYDDDLICPTFELHKTQRDGKDIKCVLIIDNPILRMTTRYDALRCHCHCRYCCPKGT